MYLVVTIVINMRLLDVNMRMSMATFATHEETIKSTIFITKMLHCGQREFLCECERKGPG